MDHHKHMGHGGMDMPTEGPMCNMNVGEPHPSYRHNSGLADNFPSNPADALHMGHHRPLHHLPSVARPLHPLAPSLPLRRRRPHRWLRARARVEPPLRAIPHRVSEQTSE